MKIINFNINKFNNSKDKKWMLGNNILYKMCSDYPNHTDPEEIRAKIWLIGRSYAASIERRSKENNKHINDDFYDYVVHEFLKFNKENQFDKKLTKIKGRQFNGDTLKDIISIHYELTAFFKKLTGKEKRSLASKYLHFHAPIFPIYDSRASGSINSIVKGSIKNSLGDKSYSAFCEKILFLYNQIKDLNGNAPILREIDTFLVNSANERERGNRKA